MAIDFERLNTDYPVDDVLRTRFNTRVHNGNFKCPFHDDDTESGFIKHDARGRLRFECYAAGCGAKGDAMDLARLATGSDDIAVQYQWLTGSGPPVGVKAQPKPKLERVFDLGPVPAEKLGEVVVGKLTPPVLHAKGFRRAYTPTLVHTYRDRDGRAVLLVMRVESGKVGKNGKLSKAFIPLRWDRTEGWVSVGFQPAMQGRPAENRLFYREGYLWAHPDKPVLVLEGEHKTDLLAALADFEDYVVISWAGGAQAMKHQFWGKLTGRKVTFWPDADPVDAEAGEPELKTRKLVEAAAKASQAAEVRIVEPLDEWLRKDIGYDAKDLLEELQREGKPASEARAIMESLARPWREEKPEPDPDQPPPGGDPEEDPEPQLPWVMKTTEKGGASISARDESNVLVWLEMLPPVTRWGKRGFKGRLSRDVFTQEVLLDGQPLPEGIGARRITHEIAVQRTLQGLTTDKVRPIISDVADLTRVNRLGDEVRALVWDRSHRHLLGYAGADVGNDRWARVAGHRWLLGLVKRMLKPGCQHDGVLVLEGLQGIGKTSFFRTVGLILGRDLFIELDRLTRDPDTMMLLAGKSVVELSEMTAHRTGDNDALKAMLTSRVDKYRRPYARGPEEVPRTCVFGGSTNEKTYLKDLTGNRRYWIVPAAGEMRLADLAADMPQLLAQAVWYLTEGEPEDAQNWLTPEEELMQEAMAKSREVEWPQFDALDEVLGRLTGTFVSREDLWKGCGFPNSQGRSNLLKTVLTKLMEDRGWIDNEKVRKRGAPRGFTKPDHDPDVPS